MDRALENLNARADTPNMRTFVRVVVQGERLGVSIGQIMRGVAHEMRLRRRQAAEERAQRARRTVTQVVVTVTDAFGKRVRGSVVKVSGAGATGR